VHSPSSHDEAAALVAPAPTCVSSACSDYKARGTMEIRRATEDDVSDIARIHVEAWRWAYKGQLPDDFLQSLSIERRTEGWRQEISDPESESRVWVTIESGRVVGFASTAPSRDEDTDDRTAELLTLYLEPQRVGTGLGRALLVHAVEDLQRRGYERASLWVLTSNERARRFYERNGWHPDGRTKADEVRGVQLNEVRYRRSLERGPADRTPSPPG
jgi:ribosomal protein S18 acetylase RimI-like enzyme